MNSYFFPCLMLTPRFDEPFLTFGCFGSDAGCGRRARLTLRPWRRSTSCTCTISSWMFI